MSKPRVQIAACSLCVASLILSVPAEAFPPLKQISPAEATPHVRDYTFMWWANGWNSSEMSLARPPILCFQTGWFGAAFDVEKMQLLNFGRLRREVSYDAAAAGDSPVFTLPKADFSLNLAVDGSNYQCVARPYIGKDGFDYPARIIESGRFFQRADILNLEFRNAEGRKIAGDARLEISVWPDRIAFLLEFEPSDTLTNACLNLALVTANKTRSDATVQGSWPAGERRRASSVLSFGSENETAGIQVSANRFGQTETLLPVEADPTHGWQKVALPEEEWKVAEALDRLDRFSLRLTNEHSEPKLVRLLFSKENRVPGITGLTPILRDPDGYPTGIPVQISKNWHRREERRALFDGAWLHAFTMLRLPARSVLEIEFNVTYGRWGGVPAVSHAQLCLIGWGWNQLWDEVAIGSWGESICYEPDAVQRRCMIDDVRPLLVWPMNGKRVKYDWTSNVGGGDFLVYYDAAGQHQKTVGMRTAYHQHGPNLTSVTYSGHTADGNISVAINVSSPRCDDITRAYHRFRYDVRKTTPFSRLAFYQLGADNYNTAPNKLIAYGNENGLIEEWPSTLGGLRYHKTGLKCAGETPWLSLHDPVKMDYSRPVAGPFANRGLIIRSWKARLGGKPAPPFASSFGTEKWDIKTANIELSPPPDCDTLLPGDFVEAEVELVVLPMSADDYYGPNEPLRASLINDGNTWRTVHRQAIGNHLQIEARQGTIVREYPPEVKVSRFGEAEIEITGGLGYVPITFSGLRHHNRSRLLQKSATQWEPVDQSVHGNDFWQTDFDPSTRRWKITYNLPLDTQVPRTTIFRLITE